jgi:hypothetical protein
MLRKRFAHAACVTVLLAAATGFGQSTIAVNSPDGKPFSQRVVAYTIDAKLDIKAKTLDATEVLEYKNLTGQPLDTFPFHLYLNAFRPESSFSREAHASGSIRAVETSYPPEKIGGIEIRQISAEGIGELTGAMQFTAPDDGNQQDHTVMQVHLPRPIAPGEVVRFHIRFHDKFPISIARNGWKRDFFMGAQWLPKVGVFWHGAWNCHQYHSTTEFFADFGTFDVKLNVPKNYIVGASGIPVGEQANADGTKTLSFHGEDIHDFAWAASPNFLVADDTFQSSLGPVKLHALVLKAHASQRQRYLSILKRTMEKFDQWYGPFPYKQMTLIDPEPDSEMFGMEYPTLITAGTTWGLPDKAYFNELVTEHEFGHQYWYGMVATNEFEEAWLDEGINSYTECKVLASLLGEETSALGFEQAHISDLETQRLSYIGEPDYDPMTRHAWQFYSGGSYGGITYGKTATVLTTLEALLGPGRQGEEVMRNVLHTYFMRYRFTHPTGEDFLRTIEEVSGGKDLRPYFEQAIYGTRILDYEVSRVKTWPVEWWKSPGKNYKGDYESDVYVHRKGDFVLPVTVEVKFEDGSKVREVWDPAKTPGNDRWIEYTYTKKSKIVSAEVDPDHQLWLDKDFFNNSYTVAGHSAASLKLANYWAVFLQLVSHLASWIV